MSKNISFTCPKCRKKLVVDGPETATDIDELLPAPCVNCGRVFTKDDVERQLSKHAEKTLKKMLEGF